MLKRRLFACSMRPAFILEKSYFASFWLPRTRCAPYLGVYGMQGNMVILLMPTLLVFFHAVCQGLQRGRIILCLPGIRALLCSCPRADPG